MIVCNPIIMILKAILNWFRLRRDYIANAVIDAIIITVNGIRKI